MTQIEVTASAVTAGPPAQLWELLCDTSRFPEGVAGTAGVTRSDGPALEGSTYDKINPILRPWRAKTRRTVIEFDPLYLGASGWRAVGPERTGHQTGHATGGAGHPIHGGC
jgi:hypothetical protein